MTKLTTQTNHVAVALVWLFFLAGMAVLLSGCVFRGGGFGHHGGEHEHFERR